MISGYNTLIAVSEIGVFGLGVAVIMRVLYLSFPPIKKFFDEVTKVD